MGYPIKHIVGFDGETYDLPEGGGGLRRLTFTWDGTAGSLKDYDSGESVTLTDDELFLFMGKSWGTSLPAINSTTCVGSPYYGTHIDFVAKCANVPERISGTPQGWYLFLPVGKSCLAYYSKTDTEITILEDQYLICEMSSAQLSDFASYGIKYKASGTWTDFTPAYGYYNRSKIFLQRSSAIMNVNDLCIGASTGGQSLDSSLVITGAFVAQNSILQGGITKVYKTIGDGVDSTEDCPCYKLCMTSGNEPPYISGLIIEDAGSVIMN